MSWSRRRVLAGLGAAPWVGCASAGTERRPPRISGTVSVRLPTITHGSLDTGFGLYLVEDHGLPLVAVAVAVAAGHRHEPPGQEGRAALAAEMLLEGMEGGDRATLLDRYGELGTTPYASVGSSKLVLRCTVHRDDAAAAVRLMLDNLRHPTGETEAFERLALEQRESLQAARGIPEAVAGFGLLLGSQGVEPPAALLADGTARSLDALTVEHVRSWLPPRLRPDRLTFLVTGDAREPDVLRWIDDATRDWPETSSSPPGSPPEPVLIPEPARPRTVLVPWPQLPQAVVAIGGPRRPHGDRGEPAEALAESLMAGLMQYELRSRQRVSYGVQSRSWMTKLGAVAQLWAKVEPADIGRAVQQMRLYFAKLEQEVQLTEDAVSEVRQAAMVGMMDDFHGAEPALGQLLRLADGELPAGRPKRRLEWLEELDANAVTLALRRIYHPERVRMCIVGDRAVLDRARAVLPEEGVVERTPMQLFGLPEPDADSRGETRAVEVPVERSAAPKGQPIVDVPGQ